MPEPLRCQKCRRAITPEQIRCVTAAWATTQNPIGYLTIDVCEPCSRPIVDQLKALPEPRPERPAPSGGPPIWEQLARIGEAIPPEERDTLPRDLARNHDHYLYGAPKREE